MPVCLTCGLAEFSCHGGLYFCEECGTQFKDHQTEEHDDEYVATNISATSAIKTSTPVKKKTVTAKRAWFTSEAFNIILYHQVQKLIELGASPHLKIIVLQLWVQYLRKCEISFNENVSTEDCVPALGLTPRKRDIQVLCGESEITGSRKRLKKCDTSLHQESGVSSDIESSDAEEKSSDNFDVTDETDNSNLSGSECSEISLPKRNLDSCKRSSFCRDKFAEVGCKAVKNWKYATKKRLPDYMTLLKTLSFCYLGLILAEDQFLISDIIRFVKDGHLPYMNVIALLPEEMKLEDCDWQMLSPSVLPTPYFVVLGAISLARFLNLPKLKHPPLLPIAVRYIKDLNLPRGFIGYVSEIISKIQYFDYQSDPKKLTVSLMFYEVKALASIIIVLKLLFGLNEKSENLHSKMTKKINELSPDLNLFVWEEWFLHFKLKIDFLKSQSMSYSKVTECLDIEHLSSYYYNNIKKWTVEKSSSTAKSFDPDFRAALRAVFSNAAIEKKFPNTVQPPSCFPLSSELHNKICICKSSFQYSNSPCFDWNIFQKNFSSTSIQYSRHYQQQFHDLIPEVSKLLSKLKKKFYIRKKKTDSTVNVDLHKSYWHLQCTTRNVKTVYKSSPKTFKWLVEFGSEYIGCNCYDLFYEIWTIEKRLFQLK